MKEGTFIEKSHDPVAEEDAGIPMSYTHRKSINSYDSQGSKRSTQEAELRSLSTTPRMSHEEFGRIVSPPAPESEYHPSNMGDQPPGYDEQMTQRAMADSDNLRRDLKYEQEKHKLLEKRLHDIEEDKKDLNVKLAALRVKLGVANANCNVSKTEGDQLRKRLQETEIRKARLEERITATTKEVARLTDPKNPDSNVNMKKVVLNDRKEIKTLKTNLEETRSQRIEVQKQIQERNKRIMELQVAIGEVRDQLDTCQSDFDVAKVGREDERKKREEVEEKFNILMEDKTEFEESMAKLQSQLATASAETSEVQRRTEQLKEQEQALVTKVTGAEKKLKDTLTQIEQEKNRNMPVRTASSIKYHQYRMARTGAITDTTPHVVVTSNGIMAPSGSLGKGVPSIKHASSVQSLPGKVGPAKITPRGRAASMPAKK